MLKLNFHKNVNLKRIYIYFYSPKVETLRIACHIQILCLSTLNLQTNLSHIKLSKYCDIDARLLKHAAVVDFYFCFSHIVTMFNINY